MNYVWRKNGNAYSPQNMILAVKFGVGNIMVWGCFSLNGTSNMKIIEGRLNAKKYQGTLNYNLKESVAKLELSNEWIFQQDNDPNHTANSTKK